MLHSAKNDNLKDMRALLIGTALILVVAIYFIGRTIFIKDTEEDQLTPTPSISEDLENNNGSSISAEVVKQKLINNEPIKFIDLRPKEQFDAEHIPNSLSMTAGALNNFTPAPNDIIVIIYSVGDRQSYEVAKNIIDQQSFTAFFLEGGYEGWKGTSNQTISNGDPNSFIDQSKVVYISTPEFLALINDTEADVFILDVQTQANFNRVHVKNAKNIPLAELEKRSKEIPSNKPIVVYGENELLSFQAGVRLSDLNIFTAKTLGGNKNLTKESGLPLEPEQK